MQLAMAPAEPSRIGPGGASLGNARRVTDDDGAAPAPRIDGSGARAAGGDDRALDVLDDPIELARHTTFTDTAEGHRHATSHLRIAGMHCAACAGILESAIGALPGVDAVRVSGASERATVQWRPGTATLAGVVRAVRAAGYDAAPDAAAPARALRQAEQRQALWRLFVASFCAMQVMMLATPSYVARAGDLAPDLAQLLNWGQWLLSLPVLAFSAGPFFRGAWTSLRTRRIGMDVPVALGLVVTFVASSGATFDPGGVFGHEVYFDSLTMFVSFLLAGRWWEAKARHRVAQMLEAAIDGMPELAERVVDAGALETVSVQRLRAGDRVRVRAGERFPADGDIVDGDTQVDEALLTGESLPRTRGVGDAVIGGSVNLSGVVDVQLTRTGESTRLAGIVALMREALTQRPAMARLADRWAAPFLWTVLLLAGLAGAVWWTVDPSRAVWVAVAVLIVTCPCALSLAAPTAVLATAGALARRGVLVQRLDALEALAKVDFLGLDKTGTATDGHLRWRGWRRVGARNDLDDAALNAASAALASASRHPVAQAIATGLASQPIGVWHTLREVAGQGVEGVDAEGRRWRLGRRAFVVAGRGAEGSEAAASAEDDAARAWLGVEGVAMACHDIDEVLRADTPQAVAQWRAQGARVVLLSGDAAPRAAALGARLGLDEMRGGLQPQDKLAAARAARAAGHVVAMAGDGLNDAPVLAGADVSFAIGHGALAAQGHADLVVTSDRLADTAWAQRMARRMVRIVHQNLAWAGAYNLVCIPLAVLGKLPPWAAGLGMAASSLLVIGNAMRLARGHAPAPPAAHPVSVADAARTLHASSAAAG